jgi:hypothetical protein
MQLSRPTLLLFLCHSPHSIVLLLCSVQGPGDEPVWRQLLQLYLDDSDPEVAHQAAAALEH